MDLSRFADDKPLHCSGLGTLVKCPWRAAIVYMNESEGEGGVAGDTGSATHAAVAAFHRGADRAASIEQMGKRISEYPQADLADAAGLFLAYAADPGNWGAELILVEEPVSFAIEAAEEDPTGAPIQVIGTLDQVRREDGILRLWDIKTSKKDPYDLLLQHTYQIAGYCVGASIKLNAKVEPGGIICPRRYKSRGPTANAHFRYAWRYDDIPQILAAVRHTVAAIRAGRIWHVPGDYCTWCPMKSPDLCLPKLRSLL